MRLVCAALLLVLALMGEASGHSWYEPECCGGNDCFPLTEDQVHEARTGYVVKIPDHDPVLIPYGEERPSQDEHFHLCWPSWLEKPRCFYAPPKGV